MLKAAEACDKVGKPFGIGLGTTSDSVDTAGAIFAVFGAELVNVKGDHGEVRRGAAGAGIRAATGACAAAGAVSYDDASNNRALISGESALIWNPPSAWAVARRDNPGWPRIAGPSPRRGAKGASADRPFSLGMWNSARTNQLPRN